MDSSSWGTERKQRAGVAFSQALKKLRADPAYRARRRKAAVAANLAVVVAQGDKTRTVIAQAAEMKLAQLSRQLSGQVNLTLDTVGRICDAVGWDFDVVFRKAEQAEALQPWQQPVINRATVLQLVRAQQGHGEAAGDADKGGARLQICRTVGAPANRGAAPLQLMTA